MNNPTETGSPYLQPDIYDPSDDKIIPLDAILKSQFERAFGADFSNVKVHTGLYADRLTREKGAFAVTIGSDIYFANGQYSPETVSGIKLLAHELQHVVQYQNNRSTEYREDINTLESEASEIEILFDHLLLHQIDAPIAEQTTVAQTDQGEIATAAAAGLKKSITEDKELGSLQKFTGKNKAPFYVIHLPSNQSIELSADEYQKLIHVVKNELINYFSRQKYLLTTQEWEKFVLKFYNYIKS